MFGVTVFCTQSHSVTSLSFSRTNPKAFTPLASPPSLPLAAGVHFVSMQRPALLGQLGGRVTSSFMLTAPKDHLVNKFFCQENMLSVKKLKPESRIVRAEFKMSESDDRSSDVRVQRPALPGQLGGKDAPSFMLSPPKDQLVEKYFYPDKSSPAEKLNLEPERVRDEFKMSESDCGSSRVQVAQLTAKIKHLSSVLHKKDKHSRRGLQAMVQRRRKLLKYLRRTDWDSYYFVISKLGLKDKP